MNLQPDFDLSARNTMGLASTAAFGGLVASADAIPAMVEAARGRNLPLHVLGGGSNVILQDHVPAVVAVMDIRHRAVGQGDAGATLVEVGAGETWHDIVDWTVRSGHFGLENLAGIPGTVGAAPVQNIGAYGVELSDVFYSAQAYDTVENRFRAFGLADCDFTYRHSAFKRAPGRFIITGVTLALPRDWRPKLSYAGLTEMPAGSDAPAIMERVLALRGSKLPDWRIQGNVGSFFHNPIVSPARADAIEGAPRYPQADGTVKLSAGWLIEQCGFKGFRVGGAGVSERHALIIVNHGGATCADVAELSAKIRSAVQTRFGVDLIQEPVAF